MATNVKPEEALKRRTELPWWSRTSSESGRKGGFLFHHKETPIFQARMTSKSAHF